jgi:hypothetical protein
MKCFTHLFSPVEIKNDPDQFSPSLDEKLKAAFAECSYLPYLVVILGVVKEDSSKWEFLLLSDWMDSFDADRYSFTVSVGVEKDYSSDDLAKATNRLLYLANRKFGYREWRDTDPRLAFSYSVWIVVTYSDDTGRHKQAVTAEVVVGNHLDGFVKNWHIEFSLHHRSNEFPYPHGLGPGDEWPKGWKWMYLGIM